LVVTHQKRTMEAADCLYGVTMAPGGSSKVVSERTGRQTAAPNPAGRGFGPAASGSSPHALGEPARTV